MSTVNKPRTWWLAALAVALVVGPPSPAAAAAPLAAPPPAAPTGVRVTLITGDTVVYRVGPDGRAAVDVIGGGTSKLYHSRDERTGTYLFPDVALPYVDTGVLDRELFNVTYLARNLYTNSVPVIVDYGQSLTAARSATALAGARPGRVLESIGATGMTVDSAGARQFWASLTGQSKQAAVLRTGGVSKVWLDRKVTAVLDQSVPQIGAPAAWAAGYDGTGTTVAVLDTGIDETHPDVAGKVVATRNFSSDESAVDGHGHGTHVASTIAGTGAASGGRYQGVAPGATLLVGKVLDDSGSGDTSWLIDGMEWAATERDADVISMSLSSNELSNGSDPMSEAVNRLTADTGALFVVAAGNDGPRSIASPGAAASALTVGAVDKANQLANFSGTGPVLDTYAIKPEITAPGVEIVAARAAGTMMGRPVDDRYTSANGTSMATPHVSGAAAIMRQRHPDWGPDTVKAALVGAAADGGFSAYAQGAGRVDVARAVSQHLRVDTSTITGGQRGPADPPLTKTLTYTNDGNTDLAVTVTPTMRDSAAARVLTVVPGTLTVPTHGSATVTVTIDQNAGPLGVHDGAVVATTASGDQVRVPVAVRNLPALNTLTVRLIKPAGTSYFSPTAESSVIRWRVLRVDDRVLPWDAELIWRATDDPNVLEAKAGVPEGAYAINGHTDWTLETGTTRRAFGNIVVPEVTVSGNTTTTVDLRKAVPAEVQTDRPTDIVWQTQLVRRISEAGYGFGGTTITALPEGYRFLRYPSAPVRHGTMSYRDGFILAEAQTMVHLRSGNRTATLRPVYLPYPTTNVDLFPRFRRDLSTTLATEADLKAGGDLRGRLVYLDVPDLTQPTGDQCPEVGSSGAICGIALKVRAAARAGAAGVLLTGQGAPLEFVEWLNDEYWVDPYVSIPVAWLDYPEARPMIEMSAGTRPVRVELDAAPEPSYEYKLWFRSTGRATEPGVYRARTADLQRVDASYHADVPAEPRLRNRYETMHLFWPDEFSSIAAVRFFSAPARRAEYHTVTGRDVLWMDGFDRGGFLSRTIVDTRPGTRSWGASPAVPGQRTVPAIGDRTDQECAICRQGDTLWVLPMLAESDTTHGYLYPFSLQSAETRLFQGGTEIPGNGRFPLPPGPGRYRLEHTTVAAGVTYGATVRTVWELNVTGRPSVNGVLPPYGKPRPSDADPAAWQPAIFLSYDIPLDLSNTTRAGRPLWMAVRASSGRPGTNPNLAGLDLRASFDDGRTWNRPLLVLNVGGGEYRILLSQPALDRTTGAVTLRTHAWDRTGNEVTQTVERAYGLRAGEPDHGSHREL